MRETSFVVNFTTILKTVNYRYLANYRHLLPTTEYIHCE